MTNLSWVFEKLTIKFLIATNYSLRVTNAMTSCQSIMVSSSCWSVVNVWACAARGDVAGAVWKNYRCIILQWVTSRKLDMTWWQKRAHTVTNTPFTRRSWLVELAGARSMLAVSDMFDNASIHQAHIKHSSSQLDECLWSSPSRLHRVNAV